MAESVSPVARKTVQAPSHTDGASPALTTSSLEDLYRVEMPQLTRFLVRVGATPYEAADAAHEAFTIAIEKWDRIREPRAWLRKVAHRCYLRQTGQRDTPYDPLPDRPGGTCPIAHVTLKEGNQRVLNALAQLPPLQRHVMAWAQDGFTDREIAQALDIREDAVRKNRSRARRRLQQTLVEEMGGRDE
ncbi:sigma-70 family RNA polymerase sigma factor [Streptomyces sp900129855]|uniref:Sigma-70 family RNA polymerase sigma factor n=1 Tax=Streptomyces sp. 900129855 TaxID=3155129 RepID=A0ABV2ZYZ3_9ACTN